MQVLSIWTMLKLSLLFTLTNLFSYPPQNSFFIVCLRCEITLRRRYSYRKRHTNTVDLPHRLHTPMSFTLTGVRNPAYAGSIA